MSAPLVMSLISPRFLCSWNLSAVLLLSVRCTCECILDLWRYPYIVATKHITASPRYTDGSGNVLFGSCSATWCIGSFSIDGPLTVKLPDTLGHAFLSLYAASEYVTNSFPGGTIINVFHRFGILFAQAMILSMVVTGPNTNLFLLGDHLLMILTVVMFAWAMVKSFLSGSKATQGMAAGVSFHRSSIFLIFAFIS